MVMNKKILFISHDVIFPLDIGARMRSGYFVKALAEEHDLYLLCFRPKPEDPEIFENLNKYFNKIWFFEKDEKVNKVSLWQRLKSLIKGMPWDLGAFYDSGFDQLFKKIVIENKFDMFFCRHMIMAQYFIRNIFLLKGKVLVDLDDIEPVKIERAIDLENNGFYKKWRKKLDCKLFDLYHKKLHRIDVLFTCSEKDRAYIIKKRWNGNVKIIPNQIDVQKYVEVSQYTIELIRRKVILFCGYLAYGPNLDALKWFLTDIFPFIQKRHPDSVLQIVGRDPDPSLLKYIDGKNIILFADVPSMIPYYDSAALSIVPLRIGGGTRIKILESFAARRPVVSTAIGAEGLEVVGGRHFLCGDSVKDFADQCMRILDDYDCGLKLVENSYEFVVKNYSEHYWKEKIVECFDEGC